VGSTLGEVSRRLIEATLAECGSKRKAADMLGISLKTLYNRLAAYKANEPAGEDDDGPSKPAPEGRRHAAWRVLGLGRGSFSRAHTGARHGHEQHDQHSRSTKADRPPRRQRARRDRPRERDGRTPRRQDRRAVGNEGRLHGERARLREAESADGARSRPRRGLPFRQDLQLALSRVAVVFPPQGASAQRLREPGLVDLAGRLISDTRQLVSDFAQLAVLDARRAGVRLAMLLSAGLLIA